MCVTGGNLWASMPRVPAGQPSPCEQEYKGPATATSYECNRCPGLPARLHLRRCAQRLATAQSNPAGRESAAFETPPRTAPDDSQATDVDPPGSFHPAARSTDAEARPCCSGEAMDPTTSAPAYRRACRTN